MYLEYSDRVFLNSLMTEVLSYGNQSIDLQRKSIDRANQWTGFYVISM